jgi:hypothetical protein
VRVCPDRTRYLRDALLVPAVVARPATDSVPGLARRVPESGFEVPIDGHVADLKRLGAPPFGPHRSPAASGWERSPAARAGPT